MLNVLLLHFGLEAEIAAKPDVQGCCLYYSFKLVINFWWAFCWFWFVFLNCPWTFNYISLQAKYVFHHEVGY